MINHANRKVEFHIEPVVPKGVVIHFEPPVGHLTPGKVSLFLTIDNHLNHQIIIYFIAIHSHWNSSNELFGKYGRQSKHRI